MREQYILASKTVDEYVSGYEKEPLGNPKLLFSESLEDAKFFSSINRSLIFLQRYHGEFIYALRVLKVKTVPSYELEEVG